MSGLEASRELEGRSGLEGRSVGAARCAVVVLAGGTSRRLDGVDKASLVLDGTPLLSRVLDAVAGHEVVVVGPRRPVPSGRLVTWTVEDPPLGGPLAGLAAGVEALHGTTSLWVLALACDLPHAADAVPTLLAASAARPEAEALVGHDVDGRAQPLLAVYALDPLRRALSGAGDLVGAPLRRLLALLSVEAVPLPARATRDVDTWQDAALLGVTVPDARPSTRSAASARALGADRERSATPALTPPTTAPAPGSPINPLDPPSPHDRKDLS